jgi:hypothetical protein
VRGARGAGLEVAAAADSRRNAGVHAPVSLASASGKALGLGALMVLRVRRLEAGVLFRPTKAGPRRSKALLLPLCF